MSTDAIDFALKAGHGPAQRVGNMRIKQSKRQGSKDRMHRNSESEDYEDLTGTSPKTALVISGAIAKGDSDFSQEAVRAIHEKPQSTFDFRTQHKSNIIHQPKKF